MNVLLSNSLRNQQNISVHLDSLLDELFVGNGAAHVQGLQHLVTLQTVVTSKALTVHDGVDTNGVSIGTGRSTNHHDLAADVLTDVLVDFFHAHGLFFHGDNMDVFVVDSVCTAAVNHVESELLIQRTMVSHVGLFQTHLLSQLTCSLLAALVILDGQSEANLSLTIVHGIAVGLDLGQIQGGIKVSLMHIVQTGTHYALPPSSISSIKGLK